MRKELLATVTTLVIIADTGAEGAGKSKTVSDAIDYQAVCEKAIKKVIKSPSSYRRVSILRSKTMVMIDFDAQNSFGATLRGDAICRFNGPSITRSQVAGGHDLLDYITIDHNRVDSPTIDSINTFYKMLWQPRR